MYDNSIRAERVMRLAYIHIGTHKAASTFLQKFILKNQKELRRRGLFVPMITTSENSNLRHNFHKPLAMALQNLKCPQSKAVFEQLRQEILNHPRENILLSSEIFEDRLSKVNVDFLESFFSKLGINIVFVAYVRSQPDYINSRYTQTIKRFWDDCSFEEYCLQARSNVLFDYGKLFSNILNNSSIKFVVRSFDGAIEYGIERDFLDVLLSGQLYDYSEFKHPLSKQNTSPGPTTIYCGRVARKIISEKHSIENRSVYWNALKKATDQNNWNTRSFMGMNNKKAREIEKYFLKINDDFALEVWNKPWRSYFENKSFSQNVFNPAMMTKAEARQINEVIGSVLFEANSLRNKIGRPQYYYNKMLRLIQNENSYSEYFPTL